MSLNRTLSRKDWISSGAATGKLSVELANCVILGRSRCERATICTDEHTRLRKSNPEALLHPVWQRRYVHILRNTFDLLLHKANDDCPTELRWIYEESAVAEARQGLPAA